MKPSTKDQSADSVGQSCVVVSVTAGQLVIVVPCTVVVRSAASRAASYAESRGLQVSVLFPILF